MMLPILILAATALFEEPRPAPTLDVCEVLERLTELNGMSIRVRGAWALGDTGDDLVPVKPCPSPIIRDGWRWQPFLELQTSKDPPADGSLSEAFEVYRKLFPLVGGTLTYQTPLILTTFTGRVVTLEHYPLRKSNGRPQCGYAAGILVRTHASDTEWMPRTPEVDKWFEEISKKPAPVRVRK